METALDIESLVIKALEGSLAILPGGLRSDAERLYGEARRQFLPIAVKQLNESALRKLSQGENSPVTRLQESYLNFLQHCLESFNRQGDIELYRQVPEAFAIALVEGVARKNRPSPQTSPAPVETPSRNPKLSSPALPSLMPVLEVGSIDQFQPEGSKWLADYWAVVAEVLNQRAAGFANRSLGEVVLELSCHVDFLVAEDNRSYRTREWALQFTNHPLSLVLEKFFEKEKRLVITGPPGAGKTVSLLGQCAKWAVKPRGRAAYPRPIIIDCQGQAGRPEALRDLIHTIRDAILQLRREDPFQIQGGVVWCFLRMGSSQAWESILEAQLRELEPLNRELDFRTIISMESNALEELVPWASRIGEKTPFLVLHPLERSQVERLMELWDGPPASKALLGATLFGSQAPRLSPEMVMRIFQVVLDLAPEYRVEEQSASVAKVYGRMIDHFLLRWRAAGGFSEQQTHLLREKLGSIAYLVHDGEEPRLALRRAATLFSKETFPLLRAAADLPFSLVSMTQKHLFFVDPVIPAVLLAEKYDKWLWNMLEERLGESSGDDPRRKMARLPLSQTMFELLRERLFHRFGTLSPEEQRTFLNLLRELAEVPAIIPLPQTKGREDSLLLRHEDGGPGLQLLGTLLLVDLGYRSGRRYHFGRKNSFLKKLCCALGANDFFGGKALRFLSSNLRYASLDECDMEGLNFQEGSFYGASLARANLRHAFLQRTDFQLAEMTGADLSDALLDQANFEGIQGRGLRLVGAAAQGIIFRNALLDECDGSYARLHGALFTRTPLRRVKFDRSDLEVADFEGSQLEECSFNRAMMWGANFSFGKIRGTFFKSSDISRSILEGVVFEDCDFSGGTLAGAAAKGASFIRCKMEDLDLRGAFLQDVTFDDCQVRGLNLSGSRGLGKQTIIELVKGGAVYRD